MHECGIQDILDNRDKKSLIVCIEALRDVFEWKNERNVNGKRKKERKLCEGWKRHENYLVTSATCGSKKEAL